MLILGKSLTSLVISFLIFFGVIFGKSIGIAESVSEEIRVGYFLGSFRSVNPKDAELAIKIWFSQICHQAGIHFNKITAHMFVKLGDLKLAVNNQKLDLVGLTSVDYIMIRNQVQLEPALITIFGNDYGNKYVLLVNKDSGIHKLRQLRARKILLYMGSSPISLLWLDHLLQKQGLPRKDSFFSYYKEVDKASQAILPVFFGQADACIVTSRAFEISAEMNPQISQKLAPIITSPLFADSLLLFRKNYNSYNKKIIIDTALNVNKYPQGKQVMTLFKINGFALFKESYLTNVITMMQESGKVR